MGHQYVNSGHRWLTIPDEQLARYGAYDSLYTAQLVPHLLKELTRRGQTRYWNERFWPMVPVITTMQRRGVGDLDRELRNRARRWVRAAIDEVETAVWNHMRGDGNYNRSTFFDSHKQLGRFLYGDLGLPRPPKTQKRADSSSSQDALLWVLAHLRKRDDGAVHVLHELFHRSRLATILERYLTIEGDPDGRVRPTIKMGAAETMRLAYAGETGEAVQQWPGEIRSLIRAKEGHIFVGRDFSQLEARILAILSNDSVSLQAFAAGRDVHSQNAIDLFGTGCQTVSKEGELVVPSTIRDYAKSFLYKLSYGGQPESDSRRLFCPCWRCTLKAPPTLDLPPSERKRAADRWEALHQPVLRWRDELLESVKGPGSNHTYVSPFGCHRVFMAPREEAKRSIYNYPLQHCASQIVNDVMMRLHYNHQAPITLQMHDSLTLEVPVDELNKWNDLLDLEMSKPVAELGGAVFPSKGGVGPTWGDLK